MQPPQYPYAPPPPPEYRPAQPKRSAWRRFRALGCGRQSLIGCLTLFVLGCGFLCILGAPAFMQGWHNGHATSTAVARGVTAAPSPTATSQSTVPRMGGSLDDFVATYGQPTATAPDSETFLSIDKLVRITAYVAAGTTTVNRIFATKTDWTQLDAYTFCLRFLPADAQEYKRITGAIAWIDYHSSLGQIVMQVQVPSCLLFISRS